MNERHTVETLKARALKSKPTFAPAGVPRRLTRANDARHEVLDRARVGAVFSFQAPKVLPVLKRQGAIKLLSSLGILLGDGSQRFPVVSKNFQFGIFHVISVLGPKNAITNKCFFPNQLIVFGGDVKD